MKLFAIAKLSGQMLTVAALKAAEDATLDADRSFLLNCSRRELQKELRQTQQNLITLVNKSKSIPAKKHNYLVGRASFITFLLNPNRVKCSNQEWMWSTC